MAAAVLASRQLTRRTCSSRASRVRWWYQAGRAWWRRRQASQCRLAPGGGRWAGSLAVPGTVSGISPGPAGGGWPGPDRGGCPGAGAAAEQGGGDGADGQGGHDQGGVPGDRGEQPDLGLTGPGPALPGPGIFFCRPAAAGRGDQPGQRHRLAGGYQAAVKGQLAGSQVAADEQVMPRAGGAQPGPGVPSHPGETQAQQFQQPCALPPAQRGAYPAASSRLRFCCLHKRMIARRLRCVKTYATLTSRSKAEWLLPY